MMQKLYNDIVKKNLLIEKFVQFFGENARFKIETMINNTTFVLIPQRVEHYKIQQILQKLDIHLDKIAFKSLSGLLVRIIKAYINNQYSLPILSSTNYNKLFNQLGIKFEDIVTKNEKGELELTHESMKTLPSPLKEILSEIDKDNFLKDEGRYGEEKFALIARYIKSLNFKAEANGGYKFKEDLSFETLESLFAVFDAKTEITEWGNNPFPLKTFNSALGTNHSSWEELYNDEKFSHIREQLSLIKKRFHHFDVKRNHLHQDMLLDETKEILASQPNKANNLTSEEVDDIRDTFITDPDTLAFVRPPKNVYKRPILALPINENTSADDIIHELQHVVAIFINEQLNKIFTGVNTSREDNSNKTKNRYTYLNEIITQYLTIEMMKEVNIDDLNLPKSQLALCDYNKGVELFKPFLDCYKELLKKCVTSKNPMIFRDRLLKSMSFDILADYVDEYMCFDEESCLIEISQALGTNIENSQQVLKYIKDVQACRLELSNKTVKYIDHIVSANNFANKLLIEKKESFLKGETVTYEDNFTESFFEL